MEIANTVTGYANSYEVTGTVNDNGLDPVVSSVKQFRTNGDEDWFVTIELSTLTAEQRTSCEEALRDAWREKNDGDYRWKRRHEDR
jgi:hypothetical protein